MRVSNAPAARLNVAGATAKPISTDLTAPKMEGKAGDKIVEVEVIKERYPNRAIKIERHVTQDAERNYVNHGTWTMWDPNGTMLGKGEFWNGKRHGKWTRWHINPSIPGDLPEGEMVSPLAGSDPGAPADGRERGRVARHLARAAHAHTSAALLHATDRADDAGRITDLLGRIDTALDLAEPFNRVREAMNEFRKMGGNQRAA